MAGEFENCYDVYVDGGVKNNGAEENIGSVGVVFIAPNGNELPYKKGYRNTTNNRMELQACIIALTHTPADVSVRVYCDSAYVVNAFHQNWIKNWKKNGWKTKSGGEVKNQDLWQKLVDLYEGRQNVSFVKVKGHSGNKYNELADELATQAMEEMEEWQT